MIQYGSGNFEVILRDQEDSEDFQVILTGSINFMSERTKYISHSTNDPNTEDLLKKSHFYDAYQDAGYSLEEEFRQINDLRLYDTGSISCL